MTVDDDDRRLDALETGHIEHSAQLFSLREQIAVQGAQLQQFGRRISDFDGRIHGLEIQQGQTRAAANAARDAANKAVETATKTNGKIDLLTKIVQDQRPGAVGLMGGRQATVLGGLATFVVSVIVGLVAHYAPASPVPQITIEAAPGHQPANPIAPDPQPHPQPPESP